MTSLGGKAIYIHYGFMGVLYALKMSVMDQAFSLVMLITFWALLYMYTIASSYRLYRRSDTCMYCVWFNCMYVVRTHFKWQEKRIEQRG